MKIISSNFFVTCLIVICVCILCNIFQFYDILVPFLIVYLNNWRYIMFINIFNVTRYYRCSFSDLSTNNDNEFLWLSKLLFYSWTIDFLDFKNLIDKSSKITLWKGFSLIQLTNEILQRNEIAIHTLVFFKNILSKIRINQPMFLKQTRY